MIKKIYDEFEQKNVSQITNCNEWQNSCLNFVFTDSSTSQLIVDPLKHTVSYSNYIIDYEEIDENIEFGELTYNKFTDFFSINIPITTPNLKGEYSINITSQSTNAITNSYNEKINTITVPLSNKEGNTTSTTITYDGTNYWMRIYDASNNVLNEMISKEIKHLKLDTCSNTQLNGKSYELKTGNDSSRWCQTGNMYTQNTSGYQYISGISHTALLKDTYKAALTNAGALKNTTLDAKVNSFIDRYTFKSR